MRNITKEELKGMIDHKDNILLINIQPYEDFKKKRIPTSHNIPINSQNFKELILETIDDKNKKIIIYSTYESPQLRIATKELENLGYKNIMEYKGGIEDWEERFSLEGSEV